MIYAKGPFLERAVSFIFIFTALQTEYGMYIDYMIHQRPGEIVSHSMHLQESASKDQCPGPDSETIDQT